MAIVVRSMGVGRKCSKCGVANEIRARRCIVCGAVLSKYMNQKTRLDGYTFDSKKEANRYLQLLMMQKLGAICGLIVHPRFLLEVNGMKICKYIADFQYLASEFNAIGDIKGGTMVVEDVKGKKTRDYVLKRKLMLAVYSIEVKEI